MSIPIVPLILQLAPVVLEGLDNLFDNGDITKEQYDAALANYNTRRAARKEAVSDFNEALGEAEAEEGGD